MGQTILVVDDDPSICEMIGDLLVHFGYKVLCAPDGQVASVLFSSHCFDIALLLTDFEMPGKNGILLIKELRALKPDLKVVLMSGNTQLDRSSNEIRGVPFLAKPFTAAQLLHEVSESGVPSAKRILGAQA